MHYVCSYVCEDDVLLVPYPMYTIDCKNALFCGYRFILELTQTLKLRTHLKLEYYIKSLHLYPIEHLCSRLVSIPLNYVFFLILNDQWFQSY